MAALAEDEVAHYREMLTKVGIEGKQLKNQLKNKKKLARIEEVLEMSGVLANGGCDKTMGALLLDVAAKLKATHRVFQEQLLQAVTSGRLDSKVRLDEALKMIHQTSPEATISDEEIDARCGVGLYITVQEAEEVVARVFTEREAEILEKRYLLSVGQLLAFVQAADPRIKWLGGGAVMKKIMATQKELLGPRTAADKEAAKKSNKSKGKAAKKKQRGKASSEAKTDESAAEAKRVFEDMTRFPSTAFNTPEAVEAHKKVTNGVIRTRFPPEPNGYLHIGHAKSCCLNFEQAFQKLGVPTGSTFLRFDDTNPLAESQEYIDSIKDSVSWLGWTPTKITHSSDHFQQLYDFAERLINQGDAYVCHQNAEQMKHSRTVRRNCKSAEEIEEKRSEIESPWRNRSAEESLQLFRDMRDGKFDEGAAVLRLKMDWNNGAPVMWDTVAYRIMKTPHPHTGDKWVIYPTYDYTHCIIDSLEHIDYSLCTLEFEARRDSYYWLVDKLAPPLYKSLQCEFARLNIEYAILSKRKLRVLVEENHVRGWDDPRLFTIDGLRRRGFTSVGINNFCRDVGFTRNDNVIQIQRFNHHQRTDLDVVSRRAFAVDDPIEIEITNFPEGQVDFMEVPNHPKKSDMGKRRLPFSRRVFISRSDWRDEDANKYYGLAPGKEVRLKHAYNITCTEIVARDDSGRVTKIAATYNPDKSMKKKIKGVLTWISTAPGEEPATAEVRLYEHLFRTPVPGAPQGETKDQQPAATAAAAGEEDEEGDGADKRAWLEDINPDSLRTATFLVDASVPGFATQSLTHIQFERIGYFVVDKDSTEANIVLNRTLPLKESADKHA